MNASEEKKTGFEIHIDQTDRAVASSTAPIRWCLDKEMFKRYDPAKIKRLQMLIVIIPTGAQASGRREQRKLVPVMDLMTYIEFRASGENLIFGAVVDPDIMTSRKKPVSATFMSKSEGRWSTDVFYDFRSADVRSTTDRLDEIVVCSQTTRLNVDVPKEVFAPPPPQWEQTFVNSIFRNPPVDQCEFRQRRMISYWAVPLVVIATTIIRAVILLFGLLVGFTKARPKVLIEPFASSLNDVFGGESRSIFRTRGGPVKIVLVQFSPLALIVSWLIFHFAMPEEKHITMLVLFGMPALTLAVYAVIGLLGAAIWCLFEVIDFCKGLNRDMAKYGAEREAARLKEAAKRKVLTDKEKARLEEMRAILTCSPANMPTGAITIKSIPREYRSVSLRFHDLKAKVCRPFAR